MTLLLRFACRWIPYAAIATLILASIYLAQVLLKEGDQIEHTYRQGTWGAVQTDSEALKLLLALERYRRTAADADLQSLHLQRELYISRILFLRDSDETKEVRSIPQVQEQLRRLFADVDRIDAGVDQVAAGDLSALDRIQALVAANRLLARDLTQHLLLKDATLLSRERLIESFQRMVISLLFILAAGAMLVLSAVRQARLARRSAREAQLAQLEITRQRQRLESALEATPDALIVSDNSGEVVFANPAYCALLAGHAAGAAPGTLLRDLLAAEAKMLEYDRSNSKLASEAGFMDRARTPGDSFLARLKDGRSLLYRARRTTEGGLVLTRTDLTERMRLERERSEFRDQFHHAMKMEALGRLAGGVAHDFNNMLTAIITFGEMLVEDLADRPQQQRMAIKTVGAAQRAAGLVRQILSFSRKDRAALQEVDIGDVAKETLALLRASTPQHILTSFEGQADALVLADPSQISQVIMNLCVNARDAINVRPGAIEIAVRHPVVDRGLPGTQVAVPKDAIGIVSAPDQRTHLVHVGEIMPNRPCVCLSVRDNGGGIPRTVLERMFEPFYTTKAVGQGSGLGLAAVHGIVLGLNGTITVETTEGAGTTFRIYFPLADTAKAKQPAVAA